MPPRVSGPHPGEPFVPASPASSRPVARLAAGAVTIGPGRDDAIAIGVTAPRGHAVLSIAPRTALEWVRRVAPLLELASREPAETRTPWLRDAAGEPVAALRRVAGPTGVDWALLVAVPGEEPLAATLGADDAARFLAALAGMPDGGDGWYPLTGTRYLAVRSSRPGMLSSFRGFRGTCPARMDRTLRRSFPC